MGALTGIRGGSVGESVPRSDSECLYLGSYKGNWGRQQTLSYYRKEEKGPERREGRLYVSLLSVWSELCGGGGWTPEVGYF
jgi:hypothetical protein